MRARPHWDRVPFVFLTGQGEHQDVMAGKKLGADDYLVKPILPDDLLVSVRARLDRQKRLDSLRDRQVADVKNAILAVMNHEIRTPVTWLAGGAELLRDPTVDLNREQVRQVLDGILAGSERLVRLAENLVFLVDVQTGEARRTFEQRKRPLADLPDLLRRSLRFAETRAHAGGVRLQLEVSDLPPLVTGDPEMIGAAVQCLLDNAIKFSKEPGAEVTLALLASGSRAVIEVRDRGVGVRTEDLARITDLFVQSGREKQEQQGTGSGLTVAREIAALHGGTLELRERAREGDDGPARAARRPAPLVLFQMPAYARNLLPPSVVSRRLEGEAPTIDVAVGYRKSNTSPILKMFLSRLDDLVGTDQEH